MEPGPQAEPSTVPLAASNPPRPESLRAQVWDTGNPSPPAGHNQGVLKHRGHQAELYTGTSFKAYLQASRAPPNAGSTSGRPTHGDSPSVIPGPGALELWGSEWPHGDNWMAEGLQLW